MALVTGANKGIGLAIARRLGEDAYVVWLGCRSRQRGDDAANQPRDARIDARAVQLDVTDAAVVAAAVAKIESEAGRFDVLVNNAGMHFGPPPPVSPEPIQQIEQIFQTNVLGALRVTQAFVPLLKKSPAAQIVMMSSGLGSLRAILDMHSENRSVEFGGYCTFKTALNMLTVELARELALLGIKVNAADPWLTSTDLTGNGPGHWPEQGVRAPVALATTHDFEPTAGFYHCDEAGSLVLQPW